MASKKPIVVVKKEPSGADDNGAATRGGSGLCAYALVCARRVPRRENAGRACVRRERPRPGVTRADGRTWWGCWSCAVSFSPDTKDWVEPASAHDTTDPVMQTLLNRYRTAAASCRASAVWARPRARAHSLSLTCPGICRSGEPLTAPIKTVKDKWKLLPAFLRTRGLTKQQIDSFNHFLDHDIKKIVMEGGNNRITCDADPTWYLEYKDIRIGKPDVDLPDAVGVCEPITPQQCRLRDMTYSAQIYVDLEYTRDKPNGNGKKEKVIKEGHCIGRMPIMLRCSHCLLTDKSDAEMAKMGECPIDSGGYFVVRGTEKVILIQEQLSKNRIIIEKDSKGYASASVTSSTAKSKTKTNIILKNGKFHLKHNSFTDGIPIVIVLKALGISSDQEVLILA